MYVLSKPLASAQSWSFPFPTTAVHPESKKILFCQALKIPPYDGFHFNVVSSRKVILNHSVLHSWAAIAGHFIWNLLHNLAALMTLGSNVEPNTSDYYPESSLALPCSPPNFSRCPVEALRICVFIFTAEDVSSQNVYISQQMPVVCTLQHDRTLERDQGPF